MDLKVIRGSYYLAIITRLLRFAASYYRYIGGRSVGVQWQVVSSVVSLALSSIELLAKP